MPERLSAFLDALEKDLAERASPVVQTLYAGGGTPTVLGHGSLERLLLMLRRAFPSPQEFTIEANPGSVDGETARLVKGAGVTRVSLGIQACSVALRAAIGRLDKGGEWETAVENLVRAGFEPAELSADLIYGIRGQTVEDVEDDVARISGAGVGHVSLYALSVEQGSRLSRQRSPATAPEEQSGVLYQAAAGALTGAGFKRYEISSFARGDRICRHNLNYWKGREWQAFGPSAVGQEEGLRYSIPPDCGLYYDRIRRGLAPMEYENLTPQQRLRETVMLGLRMDEGLDMASLNSAVRGNLEQAAEPLIRQGVLEQADLHLRIPLRHAMVLDEITAELLAVL